jgi:EAL domain-containing protein (putative c-di-GMP-specific phosphodiesterase class I)
MFDPAMRERAVRRGDIESELRRALAESQLYVEYQPVVELQGAAGDIAQAGCAGDIPQSVCAADIAQSGCAGVEALVRWRHPTRGVVPPLEFIGVAEECGLIGALGHFVLSTACRQFVAWQQQLGALAPRQLAVNLSRGQVGEAGFVESVKAVLRDSGMTPAQLQFEVTESLAVQDEALQEALRELRAIGLKLALDDFGTGYSSLASLHLLPVDTIKIDRSFVNEVVESQHHRVLIEATVRVAESLQLGTVAEGIETLAQADALRRLGCRKGQGYLFSRPLAPAALSQWLQRERRSHI